MSDRTPVEEAVLFYLREYWVDSNVNDVDSDRHFGWVSPDGTSPEVTVSNPEESPVNTGTGYTGLNQHGHPTQQMAGTVQVNCWATRDRMPVVSSSGGYETRMNPRQWVTLAKLEVERIIREEVYDAPTVDEIKWLSLMGANRFGEEGEGGDPMMWRYQIFVGWGTEPL